MNSDHSIACANNGARADSPVHDRDVTAVLRDVAPCLSTGVVAGQRLYCLSEPEFHLDWESIERQLEHWRLTEALCELTHAELPRTPSVYVVERLPWHAAAGDAWPLLEVHPEVLDLLDPHELAEAALSSGHRDLPWQISTSITAETELAAAPPNERATIRNRVHRQRSADRERPTSVTAAKIAVAGSDQNMLQFIGAVSVTSPLMSLPVASERTLPAVDPYPVEFGRIDIDSDLILYLYGLRDRTFHQVFWESTTQNAIGAVVLVDSQRPSQSFKAIDYYEQHRLPHIVAAIHPGPAPLRSISEIRRALSVPDEVLVVAIDLASPGSVRFVLIDLVEYVLDMRKLRRTESGSHPEASEAP